MTREALVVRDTYRDSVMLMRISSQLAELPGVERATTIMGTQANREILASTGLLVPELAHARPNDLCIVVEAVDVSSATAALAAADRLLQPESRRQAPTVGTRMQPRTIESALRVLPDANLAIISVPGDYAAAEARRALHRGLHVFLFSDNVPLEAEIALKREAAERGLLVMGPDCGTAIVAGVPLGFANAVRRGSIGLVGSSGTGLQEVSSLVHRLGGGISHAIGTGSHDLSDAVGGTTTLAALDALERDASTDVVALVSKPSGERARKAVMERLAAMCKPSVAYFLGARVDEVADRPTTVGDLEALALEVLRLAGHITAHVVEGDRAGGTHGGVLRPLVHVADDDSTLTADALLAGLAPTQRRVVGLFVGGTLAWEAAAAIGAAVEGTEAPHGLGELLHRAGHRVVDLGDDAFTLGRPHPVIDPRARSEALVAESRAGGVALFLLDVILGYACHPDPATALRPGMELARQAAAARGERLRVLASVTGTAGDPQGYDRQVAALRAMDVDVAPSSSAAARLAAAVAVRLAAGR
ncbi:MAG: acyl-CoA synthetase FdrA [Chloroflexi bacterium]|nr:acyl-CoA synthetase FdrA [Chloroflexota bacterium]